MSSQWKNRMQTRNRNWDEEYKNFEIDPDYYTHTAIMNILEASSMAFSNGESVKDGLMNLVMEVDKLEGLLFADGTMDPDDPDYSTKVRAFRESLDKTAPVYINDAKVANYRFRLLYNRVMRTGDKKLDLTITD